MNKKLHYIEKIILFVIMFVIFYSAYKNTNDFFISNNSVVNDLSTLLIFLGYYIFNLIFVVVNFIYGSSFNFIVAIILIVHFSYRIYLINRLNNVRKIKGKKYEDINYYREIFYEISPSFISVIEDYNVDLYRDLAAITLKLNKDGYLIINDSTITVTQKDYSFLRESEKMVIELYLGDKKQNFYADKDKNEIFSNYEKQIFKEAMDEGYITFKTKKGLLSDLKWIVPLSVISYFLFQTSSVLSFFVLFAPFIFIYKNGEKVMLYYFLNFIMLILSSFKSLSPTQAITDFFGTLFFFELIIFLPLGFIFLIISNLFSFVEKRTDFKRTKKGDTIHYNIIGLKRFMKDFSKLEDRGSKEIFLWDYYLTYSVVLNINKKAYNELKIIIGSYLSGTLRLSD